MFRALIIKNVLGNAKQNFENILSDKAQHALIDNQNGCKHQTERKNSVLSAALSLKKSPHQSINPAHFGVERIFNKRCIPFH